MTMFTVCNNTAVILWGLYLYSVVVTFPEITLNLLVTAALGIL